MNLEMAPGVLSSIEMVRNRKSEDITITIQKIGPVGA